MHLTSKDFAVMDQRYRATLVNSISGFKPANLLGTVDAQGNSNLAIMSSVVHLGSHPPLLALVIRPNSVDRHTLDNIFNSGCYTINHVTDAIIPEAHQTAARYTKEQSEFAATGLRELWLDDFAAPFVAQARIRLGLELREHQELAVNGTNLVIGEVTLASFPDECLRPDGSLDLAEAGSVALSGLDCYHRTEPLMRMAYAKPDLPPRRHGG
jgi:flavin reductase (DIM6/NTAB) family NADH-FMN oxidoreductase RutF